MNPFSLFQTYCLTVSDLTRYLRELLESDHLLQEIWVEGEVSNLSRPASGHLYFTLKDQFAALHCVIWRGTAQRLKTLPQEGSLMQVHGSISLYEAGGKYQLYADQVRPAGDGALFQEFLKVKARLEAEGLFAEERKRPIPIRPQRLGIVTSPTGAALQDILKTLKRRYPLVAVFLAPTPVQGSEAPAGIVAALNALNRQVHPDVILIARGGGSMEDLWAFNDELVGRAIAASEAPVITGVGHETDFTIADFVADLRAPTPTAAAELATPDQVELRQDLEDRLACLVQSLQQCLQEDRWRLSDTERRLARQSPLSHIHNQRQRVDELERYAQQSLTHALRLHHARLSGLQANLSSLNPEAVLSRGYAIVSRLPQGNVVQSIRQVAPGDALQIRLADGSFGAQVSDHPQP